MVTAHARFSWCVACPYLGAAAGWYASIKRPSSTAYFRAVLGAVTAGAAAALSTPSASGKRSVSRRKSKAAGASGAASDTESELSAGEEVGEPAATIASKPSAPGGCLIWGVCLLSC